MCERLEQVGGLRGVHGWPSASWLAHASCASVAQLYSLTSLQQRLLSPANVYYTV